VPAGCYLRRGGLGRRAWRSGAVRTCRNLAGKSEVCDEAFGVLVEKQVHRLDVVVSKSQVVRSSDAVTCVPDPTHDIVDLDAAYAYCRQPVVQASVDCELRDEVRLPGCQVSIPDGKDVRVRQPSQ